MDSSALRRAFRAPPNTNGCLEFGAFLEGLGTREPAWQTLAAILEADVIPVVQRCHPAMEPDEIASICLAGAFESWIAEWLDALRLLAGTRRLLLDDRCDEAFAELAKHTWYCGRRAAMARTLWHAGRPLDAVCLVEGNRSARSYFISRARSVVHETERKLRRRSSLLSRHCADSWPDTDESVCGVEFDASGVGRRAWRISALPAAQLPSQELTDRLRRTLVAIAELGPAHVRVFELLVEGRSQCAIARAEGRHPAVISRRVRAVRALCRAMLL